MAILSDFPNFFYSLNVTAHRRRNSRPVQPIVRLTVAGPGKHLYRDPREFRPSELADPQPLAGLPSARLFCTTNAQKIEIFPSEYLAALVVIPAKDRNGNLRIQSKAVGCASALLFSAFTGPRPHITDL